MPPARITLARRVNLMVLRRAIPAAAIPANFDGLRLDDNDDGTWTLTVLVNVGGVSQAADIPANRVTQIRTLMTNQAVTLADMVAYWRAKGLPQELIDDYSTDPRLEG